MSFSAEMSDCLTQGLGHHTHTLRATPLLPVTKYTKTYGVMTTKTSQVYISLLLKTSL